MSKLSAKLTRRAILETGLLAGAAVALPPWADASDASKLQLIKKRIPSSGEEIPIVGIGADAFRMANYDALREVLKRAHELGGRVIDTAASYHDSETVIGKALAEDHIRQHMFIVTKFDLPDAPGNEDHVTGEASFERSLMRLQTDRIDLMQVHHLVSLHSLMPLLQKLKKDGKVRYIGISTVSVQEHRQLIEIMHKYPIDFVEVDYSLGSREAAETVFPVARERKVGIIVAEPLGGNLAPGAKSLMGQVSNRQLPPWASDIGVTSWSQFFLKYVISHPDVTCAIPGSTKVEHLVENQLAGHGPLADESMRKRMEEYWDAKA